MSDLFLRLFLRNIIVNKGCLWAKRHSNGNICSIIVFAYFWGKIFFLTFEPICFFLHIQSQDSPPRPQKKKIKIKSSSTLKNYIKTCSFTSEKNELNFVGVSFGVQYNLYTELWDPIVDTGRTRQTMKKINEREKGKRTCCQCQLLSVFFLTGIPSGCRAVFPYPGSGRPRCRFNEYYRGPWWEIVNGQNKLSLLCCRFSFGSIRSGSGMLQCSHIHQSLQIRILLNTIKGLSTLESVVSPDVLWCYSQPIGYYLW